MYTSLHPFLDHPALHVDGNEKKKNFKKSKQHCCNTQKEEGVIILTNAHIFLELGKQKTSGHLT